MNRTIRGFTGECLNISVYVWEFIALVSGLENFRTQKSQFLSVSRNQKHQATYTETARNKVKVQGYFIRHILNYTGYNQQ